MAIEDWTPQLKSVLEGVVGLEQVHNYDELPGTITAAPTALILPRSGDTQYSAGGPNVDHHRVDVVLYTPAQLLPESYAVLVPFIDRIKRAIASHVKLNGTVEHCLPVAPPEAWYEGPGGMTYGDKSMTGVVFRLTVKERTSFTVSV